MNNINIFKDNYRTITIKINDLLTTYNNNLIKEENSILKRNLELFKNLNSDGKLIRGFLIYLGYKLSNPANNDYCLPLALAYEIFQTAILVHDDIIDCDNKRRGKETIHYANTQYYKSINSNTKHLANSIAICIGDYGLYEANQVITKNYKNDSNLGNILEYFNDIVLKTIKGELIDVVFPFESKHNLLEEDLEKSVFTIYNLKTAYYTIIGPLCLGMILGSCDNKKINEIAELARDIGIAFQIQDDILGIFGENIGKPVGSDIKDFKQTILYAYVYKYKTEYLDDLKKYYGQENYEDVLKNVQDIFTKSGALTYAENKMNELYNEGINKLNNINWLKEEDKQILLGFIDYLKQRKK